MTQKNIIAICLFFFFLCLFAFTARGRPQVSDEAAVLGSAVAVAVRGHLAIDDLQWLQDQEGIGAYGPDGRLYAKYFPGAIFSATLLYKLGARQPDQPFVWNHQQMAPSARGRNWLCGRMRCGGRWRRFFCWRRNSIRCARPSSPCC